MLLQLPLSFTFTLTYAHSQEQIWREVMVMEGKNSMNQEHRQHSYPQRNQQARTISSVPPIQSSQVWIGLSEPQQQLVATTVIKICQMLAHGCPQQTTSEGGTY